MDFYEHIPEPRERFYSSSVDTRLHRYVYASTRWVRELLPGQGTTTVQESASICRGVVQHQCVGVVCGGVLKIYYPPSTLHFARPSRTCTLTEQHKHTTCSLWHPMCRPRTPLVCRGETVHQALQDLLWSLLRVPNVLSHPSWETASEFLVPEDEGQRRSDLADTLERYREY